MRHIAVDFTENRGFLGLANFEKLGHPRQTAGNILGLGGGPGQFGHNVAGFDLIAFFHHQNRIDRQHIARHALRTGSLAVFPSSSLMEIRGRTSAVLDSIIVRLDFPVTGSTFSCRVLPGNHIPEFNGAVDLGDDRGGKRIPDGQQIAGFRPPGRL